MRHFRSSFFRQRVGSNIGSNNETEARFPRIPLPIFNLLVGVRVAVSHAQTGMTDPLRLQFCRRPILPQDCHPCVTVCMETTERNTEFFQQRMEHALAEISRVDWCAIARLKNATRLPTREVLSQEFGKLRVDIDSTFSILRLCRRCPSGCITEGLVEGPRMQVATRGIAALGQYNPFGV
jgi:hypothetical protein